MKRLPVNDWVRHETTAKAMRPGHWVYGGSDFYKGNFIPEDSGQIAAIFITDTALINYPGQDNINDEVWTVMTERVPDLETKVTLVLAPPERTLEISKPRPYPTLTIQHHEKNRAPTPCPLPSHNARARGNQ
jgi:hypothetical protein